MIDAAIKTIAEMTRGEQRIEVIDPAKEQGRRYLLRKPDGTVEWLDAKQQLREYRAYTLGDLCYGVEQFSGAGPVIFCGHGLVAAVLNEGEMRDERLRLELPYSHEYEALEKLGSERPGYDQREFIALLRIDLAGCVPDGFLLQMRNLKFADNKAGEAKLTNSNESLGANIERTVHADGKAIPDEVRVQVCVYRDLVDVEYRMQVECVVDVNLAEQRFRMIPKAGELEATQRLTDDLIKNVIEKYFEQADTKQSPTVLCGRDSI